MADTDLKSKVPAVTRASRILELIMEKGKCSAKDFIDDMKISRSSLYMLLDELSRLGFIHRDERGSYKLWLKLMSLGEAARTQLDLRSVIKPKLDDLLKKTGCLASYFGIMSGESAYFMIKSSNDSTAIETKSKEGMPIDFLHSGIGKCLLAFSDGDTQQKIISSLNFKKITDNSLASVDDLQSDLALIVSRGWSFNDSEDDPEIRSIGVPIHGNDGRLIGAVSIVGTINRMSDQRLKQLAYDAQSCAETIRLLAFN